MCATSVVQEWSPSLAVVETIASREGVDSAELDVPLYEAVDPDALDALFRKAPAARSGGPVRIEFTYCGYRVTVGSDGSVQVSADS